MRAVIDQRAPSSRRPSNHTVQNAADSFLHTSTEAKSAAIERSMTTGETRRWPVRSYFDAGQSTPIAALQTMAWACDQGDMKTMARLFIIDDEARPAANATYAALPDAIRHEWKSLEAFAAAIIVHNGIEQPYLGNEILALARIEPVSQDRVVLQLPGAIVSGVVFQLTSEGWKYVIRSEVVDDYTSRYLTPPSP